LTAPGAQALNGFDLRDAFLPPRATDHGGPSSARPAHILDPPGVAGIALQPR